MISGGNAGEKGNGGWPYCAGGTGGKGGIWYQKFYITIPKTSYTVTIGGQSAHSKFVSRAGVQLYSLWLRLTRELPLH